jgi:hypothetical protein
LIFCLILVGQMVTAFCIVCICTSLAIRTLSLAFIQNLCTQKLKVHAIWKFKIKLWSYTFPNFKIRQQNLKQPKKKYYKLKKRNIHDFNHRSLHFCQLQRGAWDLFSFRICNYCRCTAGGPMRCSKFKHIGPTKRK